MDQRISGVHIKLGISQSPPDPTTPLTDERALLADLVGRLIADAWLEDQQSTEPAKNPEPK